MQGWIGYGLGGGVAHIPLKSVYHQQSLAGEILGVLEFLTRLDGSGRSFPRAHLLVPGFALLDDPRRTTRTLRLAESQSDGLVGVVRHCATWS